MSTSAPTAPRKVTLLDDVDWHWHGSLDFAAGDALNLRDAEACATGAPPCVRLFTPAAAVLTLGRRVHDVASAGLADTVARCEAAEIAVLEVDRGGQATLHLPGQLVALIAVPCTRLQLTELVDTLLDGAAAVARSHGLQPERGAGLDTGLWLDGQKLASVGLRHQGGVARHGLALNCAIDPALSATLVLCGHRGRGYVDLRAAGRSSDLSAIVQELVSAWRLAAR